MAVKSRQKTTERLPYAQQLRDPRWQRKRLEILSRDNWTCQVCGDTKTTLHVHHHMYNRGALPWEYTDDNFLTVCEPCHTKANLVVGLILCVPLLSCHDKRPSKKDPALAHKWQRPRRQSLYPPDLEGPWDIAECGRCFQKLLTLNGEPLGHQHATTYETHKIVSLWDWQCMLSMPTHKAPTVLESWFAHPWIHDTEKPMQACYVLWRQGAIFRHKQLWAHDYMLGYADDYEA